MRENEENFLNGVTGCTAMFFFSRQRRHFDVCVCVLRYRCVKESIKGRERKRAKTQERENRLPRLNFRRNKMALARAMALLER